MELSLGWNVALLLACASVSAVCVLHPGKVRRFIVSGNDRHPLLWKVPLSWMSRSPLYSIPIFVVGLGWGAAAVLLAYVLFRRLSG